jgi:hypothetical protein
MLIGYFSGGMIKSGKALLWPDLLLHANSSILLTRQARADEKKLESFRCINNLPDHLH